MRTVKVATASPYAVELGANSISFLGARIKALCPSADRIIVVSDNTVFPLYGTATMLNITRAGLSPEAFRLPHGEASKTSDNLLKLLNFSAQCHLTRSDAFVALGGGVIGDLTGLAAAVYMRGIAYFQIPTTLLSSVDSSVGGKTAVDLPAGKNLMGAFWQPKHVLCDTDIIGALPDNVFTDGCAEIIKTAVLFDPELFETLSRDGKSFQLEDVIARCVSHKRDVVQADERDTGMRALLNLGHTMGHAIEKCSHFSVTHGQAVSAGMAIVTRAAASAGFCSVSVPKKLCALLTQFGLATGTSLSADDLMTAMLSDKKRSGDVTHIIVPEEIGRCSVRTMADAALSSFMRAGFDT